MVELQLELDSSVDAEWSRAVRGSWFACVHLRVASNWFTELYCDGETGLSLHSMHCALLHCASTYFSPLCTASPHCAWNWLFTEMYCEDETGTCHCTESHFSFKSLHSNSLWCIFLLCIAIFLRCIAVFLRCIAFSVYISVYWISV